MKRIPLFLVILLIACNGSKSDKSTDHGVISKEVTDRLSMEGQSEMPHVVLISGDEEYRSEEALPQLAKILSKHHGINCTVLFAQDPAKPGIVDPNHIHNIPGLDVLESADLMIIFTRFRALPDEQMKHIENYLLSGRPVLGIRTATHAFHFKDSDMESNFRHYGNFSESGDAWQDGFGRLVLGEKWISHHGRHAHESTRGIVASGLENHEIMNGIVEGSIWGPTDVYGVRLPLPGDAMPIVMGQVVLRDGEMDDSDPLLGMKSSDRKLPGIITNKNDQGEEVKINQNDPMMPIAWTKSYQIPNGQQGKVFTTTIGSSTDLLSDGTRRLIVNATFWCLGIQVPEEANVDIVGSYNPSRFAFHTDEYWDTKNLSISSLR